MALVQKITEILRERILKEGSGVFPPARELARELEVSYPTMLRALDLLRNEGLLRHGRGRRVRFGEGPPEAPVRLPPADSLTNLLEQQIHDGDRPVGEPFPKIQAIALEQRVSQHTVLDALRMLQYKGLAHRDGRAWIAGPQPVSRQPVLPHEAPLTILLVSKRPDEWSDFYHGVSQRLAMKFGMEADAAGIRLLPVLMEDGGGELFSAGRPAIAALARELGGALLGFALLPLRQTMPDLDSWLAWLAHFHKPVVWLQDNQPWLPVYSAPNIYRVSYGDWGKQGHESSTGIASKALLDAGHNRILMPCRRPSELNWFHSRAQLLQESLRESGVKATLRVHADESLPWNRGLVAAEALWNRVSHLAWPGIRALRDKIREAGGFRHFHKLATRDEAHFVEDAALLADALIGGDETAIVAGNDAMAKRFFVALRMAGFRIPQDISLVSFDNSMDLKPFPVDTVDFGMERLGYQAFHLLFGVLPVQAGRSRLLLGSNALVRAGSIAPPRRERRIL